MFLQGTKNTTNKQNWRSTTELRVFQACRTYSPWCKLVFILFYFFFAKIKAKKKTAARGQLGSHTDRLLWTRLQRMIWCCTILLPNEILTTIFESECKKNARKMRVPKGRAATKTTHQKTAVCGENSKLLANKHKQK